MTDQQHPAPLVAAEVDLRDFAFMPLDVQRLRDSDLASDETPEACWAAVLLWCASWHQVPAGSIPNSDEWQAKQAGYKAQGRIAPAWRKVRTGALRGWVLCSDGRLYHPVIAEKAVDAWRSKLRRCWSTECGRIKKHNQRHGTTIPLPEFEAWLSSGCPQGQPLHVPEDKPPTSPGNPGETPSKGQGEGQGQGQGDSTSVVGAASAAPPRGSRLPDDWLLPKAWGEWALAKYPQWTPEKVRDEALKFRNHWTALTGKAATKRDWQATWQNWCMSDIAHRDDRRAAAPSNVEPLWRSEQRARTAAFAGPAAAKPAPEPEIVDATPRLLG